jgi:hypothetical protein
MVLDCRVQHNATRSAAIFLCGFAVRVWTGRLKKAEITMLFRKVVAQVLGQVMPERRLCTAVETAYGTARLGRMALLLDRRS